MTGLASIIADLNRAILSLKWRVYSKWSPVEYGSFSIRFQEEVWFEGVEPNRLPPKSYLKFLENEGFTSLSLWYTDKTSISFDILAGTHKKYG